MRLLCSLSLLFCCLFTTIAQTDFSAKTIKTIDSRLLDAFESSYLQRVQYKNPTLLKRWTFYLDHSYYLAAYIPKKFGKTTPSIDIKDLSTINIFNLEKEHKHLKRDWNKPMAYRISGTDKMLVYQPGKAFMEQFQDWVADGDE